MTPRLTVAVGLLLLIPAIAQAQAQDLKYQSRGTYNEGVWTQPSNGPSLDLIGAQIGYDEPGGPDAGVFHAAFYLPDTRPVYLSIREAEARYFYLLDKLGRSTWLPCDMPANWRKAA
jgi:hypothetical protein